MSWVWIPSTRAVPCGRVVGTDAHVRDAAGKLNGEQPRDEFAAALQNRIVRTALLEERAVRRIQMDD